MSIDWSDIFRNGQMLLAELGLPPETKIPAHHIRCPFHDDRNGSMSIFVGHGGEWLWKCHAGCGSGSILNARMLRRNVDARTARAQISEDLGIRLRKPSEPDLDMNRANTMIEKAIEYRERMISEGNRVFARYLTNRAISPDVLRKYKVGFLTDIRFRNWSSWVGTGWVMPITDMRGNLVGVKVHYEKREVDGMAKCVWAPFGRKIPGQDKVANGKATLWPPVEDFREKKILYLCPGELKALAVISSGRNATSVTTGESGNIPSADVDRISGYGTVIIPADSDDTGKKWAEKIRRQLEKKRIECKVIDAEMMMALAGKMSVSPGVQVKAKQDSPVVHVSEEKGEEIVENKEKRLRESLRKLRKPLWTPPRFNEDGECVNLIEHIRGGGGLSRNMYAMLSIGLDEWMKKNASLIDKLRSMPDIPEDATDDLLPEWNIGSPDGKRASNWNAERRHLLSAIDSRTYPGDYDIVTGMAAQKIRRLISVAEKYWEMKNVKG